MQRQIKRFTEETDRLADNKSLSEKEKKELLVDKYSIVFSRILYVLDQVVVKVTTVVKALYHTSNRWPPSPVPPRNPPRGDFPAEIWEGDQVC